MGRGVLGAWAACSEGLTSAVLPAGPAAQRTQALGRLFYLLPSLFLPLGLYNSALSLFFLFIYFLQSLPFLCLFFFFLISGTYLFSLIY